MQLMGTRSRSRRAITRRKRQRRWRKNGNSNESIVGTNTINLLKVFKMDNLLVWIWTLKLFHLQCLFIACALISFDSVPS